MRSLLLAILLLAGCAGHDPTTTPTTTLQEGLKMRTIRTLNLHSIRRKNHQHVRVF